MAWNCLGRHLKNRVLGQIDPILCVCVCVHVWCMCVCRCKTMMCELSFLLTLMLWSPLLPTLCSPCKKKPNRPFLDSVTSLRSISMILRNSSAFGLRGCLLPGLWWKQSLPRRAQLHIRGGKRKFYQHLNPTVQHEFLEELEFFRFSKVHVRLGKDSCSLICEQQQHTVRELKEVRPQEQDWFLLVDFLVTSWSNIFYQSLKYLTSINRGKWVT